MGQAIVGIKMIDGSWSYELVIYENRGWDRFLVQNIEADLHQIGTVTFREKSHGTDEPGVCFAHFGAALGSSVLTHDGASIGATRFFERPQGTDGADVI